MSTFLGLLSLVLFFALIIGLIKPSLILKWAEKPTRLKVLGYWFGASILLGIIGFATDSEINSSKIKIDLAKDYIKKGKFDSASSILKDITEEDSLYVKSQEMIKNINIQVEKKEEEKQKIKIKEEKLANKSKEQERKEQLEREIKSINEGVDFSTYRGTVEALQLELLLFGMWANIVRENKNSENLELKKLANTLKSKARRVQVKEFPKLRKEYAKVVADKIWENDIEVYANGKGRKFINFTGGVFAANKNKKDWNNQVYEILKMLRFTQSRYRWYKNANEFTYWSIYKGKDSDLVTFNN